MLCEKANGVNVTSYIAEFFHQEGNAHPGARVQGEWLTIWRSCLGTIKLNEGRAFVTKACRGERRANRGFVTSSEPSWGCGLRARADTCTGTSAHSFVNLKGHRVF